MKYKIIKVIALAPLLACSFNTEAQGVLRYNPFEQPDMTTETSRSKPNNAVTDRMILRGTVIDGDDSLVNISGKFYRLNQEVGSYRIIGIEGASVILRRGNTETVLTVHDDE